MVEDIYVVTCGKYSDYSVDCAFSTEAEAKSYCDEMNSREEYDTDTYQWQRVDLNPPLPSIVEKVVHPKIEHHAHIEPGTYRDPQGEHTFYRVKCSCNYVSGPLWTEKAADGHRQRHENTPW
jgi:hypothetical protein